MLLGRVSGQRDDGKRVLVFSRTAGFRIRELPANTSQGH